MAIKIVERCSVSPSPGGAAEQSLPLVYFDIMWLHRRPTQTVYFYALNCSESSFLETIVVKLKQSLSTTLKHFLPLASNIIYPLTSPAMPLARYAPGDSVSLTIATSAADFANLTANHPKNAGEFHQFVPPMPPPVYSSDEVKFKAIAIQVTLFPNKGICIGFTHHHAVCDAVSLFDFLRTWASVNKSDGGQGQLVQPFYGRDSVQDSNKLSVFSWNSIKMHSPPTLQSTISPPSHKVRATFILSDAEITKLKNLATGGRVSTFVVVCAYIWSCLAKSATAAGEKVDDEEPEYLTSPVECRARLNPPLPETYFGNCLVFLRAVSTHGRLKGDEGFAAAAEAIAAAIEAAVGGGGGVLDGFEDKFDSYLQLKGKRVTPIAGSSRINRYSADYGWGRGVKYECIHTDFDGSVTLCKGRDGGVEMGLSLPKPKMDAFSPVFNTNL